MGRLSKTFIDHEQKEVEIEALETEQAAACEKKFLTEIRRSSSNDVVAAGWQVDKV